MPRYIALLRGINVGGNTMIKMPELKAAFEGCGFENVVTYINSGNIAFDAEPSSSLPKPARSKGILAVETLLTDTIEQAVQTEFDKQIPVMIREQSEMDEILTNNPFAGQFESHKEMHVLFLKEEMPSDKQQQLLEAATPPERFEVNGREVYCHLPMGVAESLLGKSFIEKKLKVAVTGRNWRTVEKLAEL